MESSAMETKESAEALLNKIDAMKQSFFNEGFLIQAQFEELEQLQDKESPNFVHDIFCVFFKDTTRQFAEIEQLLYQGQADIPHELMNRFLHRLKGSVLSIGAIKTLNEVDKMRPFYEDGNMEGLIAAFERVKAETENLRVKVLPYLQLLRQVGSYGKEKSLVSQVESLGLGESCGSN